MYKVTQTEILGIVARHYEDEIYDWEKSKDGTSRDEMIDRYVEPTREKLKVIMMMWEAETGKPYICEKIDM